MDLQLQIQLPSAKEFKVEKQDSYTALKTRHQPQHGMFGKIDNQLQVKHLAKGVRVYFTEFLFFQFSQMEPITGSTIVLDWWDDNSVSMSITAFGELGSPLRPAMYTEYPCHSVDEITTSYKSLILTHEEVRNCIRNSVIIFALLKRDANCLRRIDITGLADKVWYLPDFFGVRPDYFVGAAPIDEPGFPSTLENGIQWTTFVSYTIQTFMSSRAIFMMLASRIRNIGKFK